MCSLHFILPFTVSLILPFTFCFSQWCLSFVTSCPSKIFYFYHVFCSNLLKCLLSTETSRAELTAVLISDWQAPAGGKPADWSGGLMGGHFPSQPRQQYGVTVLLKFLLTMMFFDICEDRFKLCTASIICCWTYMNP